MERIVFGFRTVKEGLKRLFEGFRGRVVQYLMAPRLTIVVISIEYIFPSFLASLSTGKFQEGGVIISENPSDTKILSAISSASAPLARPSVRKWNNQTWEPKNPTNFSGGSMSETLFNRLF